MTHSRPAVSAAPEGTANLLIDYYDTLREVAEEFDAVPRAASAAPGTCVPAFALPEPTAQVREFLEVARVRWRGAGEYRDQRLHLLDLALNPGTNTTKTFPSLLIVARAVEHIRTTGRPLVIFSPTSGNKGTALRDAVHRAIRAGLVTPDQLRIMVLAPHSSAAKLRQDGLSRDPELAALNPLCTLDSPRAEDVKALGREFVDTYAARIHERTGALLWFSLELNNYLLADVARALFEHDVHPVDQAAAARTHVHAVSSAFGLLGYHRGRQYLERSGLSDIARRPHSLLVQHLSTPDMVLSLRSGGFERTGLPAYRLEQADGLYHQDADAHFPSVTEDPDELLDPTFYTHRPATSPLMNDIIARHGGDGIVVSGRECRERYPLIRELLAEAGVALPRDFAALHERSLVMAMTGAFNAIDRSLIKPDHELVVHGSGWYTAEHYTPLGTAVRPVATAADLARELAP
ncbi:hypothetical protein KDL01_17310 [Actinospica durhamensis]|uniref:Uncharacterized protein n=1 Tax=Actinospica durhamensis TaxID=1508375 RepID=A0A941ENN3_9ACTN|nr:DUF6002 family protein [Actinospica durhamensis]MBR7835037.1 hypothetical protein [Actinospica durhamensis]